MRSHMNLTERWAHYKYSITVCYHMYYGLLPAVLSSSMYHQASPSPPPQGELQQRLISFQMYFAPSSLDFHRLTFLLEMLPIFLP